MTAQFDNTTFAQALILTTTWDFSLAIEKILEYKGGAWDQIRAERAVLNYQRYMAVTKALGGLQLVPNGDIDEIWHMHILDTRTYMTDCDALFGEYLHHYPYFGMLSDENRQQWFDVQAFSNELWQKLFSEPLYQADNSAQKCPQVCPCHVDDVMITPSLQNVVLKSA
ncbi:glycine-rich domain-containing protein [Erwinia rhapontici]|uniref:glycine-rich domain-containing protein n=1 Tax=Erwinia rhapontici TaxID=55212 RepID=UPI003BA1FC28